ncbi:TolC family protein [Pseudomonas fulva]|uniref:TolC family protein n=1 Tax=Pseudomonas fulva TaxID=47880 RepID=UPI00201D2E2B|nr:TolC family protein [Pseudomonas fulva]UQY33968.1 TolC family protein [Pseudomonas fulva]
MKRLYTLLLPCALLLAGCSRLVDHGAAPETVAADPHIALQPLHSWEEFADPVLQQLVETALRDNLDLALAAERIREARALRRASSAERLPNLMLSGTYTDASAGEQEGNQYFYGVALAWELDLFGRLGALRDQASALLGASQEDHRALQISLAAEVAATYLEYRLARRLESIAIQASAGQSQTAEVNRVRLELGTLTLLDLRRTESLLAVTRAQEPAARQRADAARYRLAYLLGSEPATLSALLEGQPHVFSPPQAPHLAALADLPSEVLRNRPDVRAAERRLDAAEAELTASRAARYPQLSLGALAGFEQGLVSPVWSVTGGLLQPLLDAGRTGSRIEASDARLAQARLGHRNTLLRALSETRTAAKTYSHASERGDRLGEALRAAEQSVELAKHQFDAGTASSLEVLDAERSLFEIQGIQAQVEVDIVLSWVELNRALGRVPAAIAAQTPQGPTNELD